MEKSPNHGSRIAVEAIECEFSEVGPVLLPISLLIEPGEFVSVLGPSGCGKSTLLRIIAGLEEAKGGRVTIEPQSGKRGFVFQESQLLPWRTVLENVALPIELEAKRAGCTGSAVDHAKLRSQLARECLKSVGLEESQNLYPNQLSGGMKMRVSVARALVSRPALLLLDEPFSALDEANRHRLQEELRALWQKFSMTLIFVTHSVAEAVFLSTRVVVLSARPARVLFDQRSSLPLARDRKIRTSSAFTSELERLYLAMENEETRRATL